MITALKIIYCQKNAEPPDMIGKNVRCWNPSARVHGGLQTSKVITNILNHDKVKHLHLSPQSCF